MPNQALMAQYMVLNIGIIGKTWKRLVVVGALPSSPLVNTLHVPCIMPKIIMYYAYA